MTLVAFQGNSVHLQIDNKKFSKNTKKIAYG